MLVSYEATSQKALAGEGKEYMLLDCVIAHLSLFLTESHFHLQ